MGLQRNAKAPVATQRLHLTPLVLHASRLPDGGWSMVWGHASLFVCLVATPTEIRPSAWTSLEPLERVAGATKNWSRTQAPVVAKEAVASGVTRPNESVNAYRRLDVETRRGEVGP